MKSKTLLASIAVAAFLLTGCAQQTTTSKSSSTESSQAPVETIDLDGTYGGKADGLSATIKDDAITINWVDDDTTSLYWAGSVEAAKAGETTWKWSSKNDHDKTDGAMLASPDDTKQFTATADTLSFSVSALGTTKTMKLKKH